MHPPSLAVPEEYIKVQDVTKSLFRWDRRYIGHLLEKNYFTNATRKRVTTNPLSRKPETMFTPSCTLKSTLWLKALVTSAQAASEEELDDSEDKDECQWKLRNLAIICCTTKQVGGRGLFLDARHRLICIVLSLVNMHAKTFVMSTQE